MRQSTIIAIIIVCLAIVFCAWYFFPHDSNSGPDLNETSQPNVVFMLQNGTADTVYVQVADTLQEQEQGLMNVTDLPEDNGMIFVFGTVQPESFWMKNTPLPLDMVFVSDNLTINDINYNATPENESIFTSSGPCKYVIEVNGGYCEDHDIGIGDKIEINGAV